MYYSPGEPAAFVGVKRLVDAARAKGIKPSITRKWLESQVPYTLHKPVRKRFKRNRVVVNGMDEQWQADLVDVQALKDENDGFRYLLTVIDVLSKYAWVVPLKDKTGKNLVKAFDSNFEQDERIPDRLQTDEGTEFTNQQFQKFLQSKGVQHFVTYNETKAQIVERFNRTLKTRMWRFFTQVNSYRYLDDLDDLVDSYNSSRHRSIGTAPNLVTLQMLKTSGVVCTVTIL